MRALKAGKHILVEKPLATTSEEANRLIEEAKKRNLILMVDDTFIFTPAVRKIKELVTSGVLGDLYYYDAVRINLGLFQHDVNVVWDLAVHDLAILDFWWNLNHIWYQQLESAILRNKRKHCLSHIVF